MLRKIANGIPKLNSPRNVDFKIVLLFNQSFGICWRKAENSEQYDLFVDIVFQDSSHLYFHSLTDYLTFIGLLGEICKCPYENTHLFTLQVIVSNVLFFSQQILNPGFKIWLFSKYTILGLLKNVLTFNSRWLEVRVMVAKTFL